MTRIQTLDDLPEILGKRLLLRVDLNVPAADGKITDSTRIERVAPTILELSSRGAKVVLLSHFGRPGGKKVESMSLRPVADVVEQILDHRVHFATDCVGSDVSEYIDEMANGDILLLENTRFYPGEESNDPDFAKALAANGDFYVNDAFSASHRAHASTEAIAHMLPGYAGRSMEIELKALQRGLESPARPLMAIIGGAKVSTKIDLLLNLVSLVDTLAIAGGMANTFLAARGTGVGKSLCEHDLAATARQIMVEAASRGCAVLLPVDAVVAEELSQNADSSIVPIDQISENQMILDIGHRTVQAFSHAIDEAQTLVWNGPLGAFETEPFDRGTVAVARYAGERTVAEKLVTIAGGGDTVSALNLADVSDSFSYVSTAGGAFLEWMEGKPLPGLTPLYR